MRVSLWIKFASIAIHAEKLLTADGPGAGADDVAAIKALLADLGRVLIITNEKDYGMIELWDDRCVQVEINTGRRMDGVA